MHPTFEDMTYWDLYKALNGRQRAALTFARAMIKPWNKTTLRHKLDEWRHSLYEDYLQYLDDQAIDAAIDAAQDNQ